MVVRPIGALSDDGGFTRMVDIHAANPQVMVSPIAFRFGGIDKGYNGVPPVTCDSIGPRISWRMATLGSIILHEYFYFRRLFPPPVPIPMIDFILNIASPLLARRTDCHF